MGTLATALYGGSLFALGVAWTPAIAQVGQAGTAVAPPSNQGVAATPTDDPANVITVTARKREETLIDVPVSVDVVSAAEMLPPAPVPATPSVGV